jgi:uncharacterized protein YecT (DUF1311 family)
MKNHFFILICILTFTSFTSLFAQQKTDAYKLALGDYKESEKEMNTTYNKILKSYAGDAEFVKRLKESQRIWLLSRDADLEMIFPEHKSKPGEYGPGLPNCKIWELKDMTDQRIDFLNQWVDGVDEGTDCAGSRKATGEDGD